MLAWIFRRRRRRPGVFYYHDGIEDRMIDPVRALIALDTHPKYVAERDGKGIDRGDAESTLLAAEAVRDVFGVKDLHEGGLTVDEQITILYRFYAYVEAQKKSGSASPTAQSPMESTSNDSNEETPKDSPGYGSTSSEPSCDTPTELDKPSTPPSGSVSEGIDTERTGSSPQSPTPSEDNSCTTSIK